MARNDRYNQLSGFSIAGPRTPPSNKRMDQPSVYAFKGSGMTERLALIRVRSPRRAPGERFARRSCADR
jgi:hypothetical protein